MTDSEKLKGEIKKIKERNKRVEKDKAWETSWMRRTAIAVSTYLLISIFLIIIKVEKPLLAAIIPSVAYLISTSTLSVVRNWWLKNQK